MAELRICDDEDNGVDFSSADADAIWSLVQGFDAATVSACRDCRSRVLAVVAVVDVVHDAAPHPGLNELLEIAEEAPTMHLYSIDGVRCAHERWHDPGATEWAEVVGTHVPRH